MMTPSFFTTKCLKALEGGLSTGLSPRQAIAYRLMSQKCLEASEPSKGQPSELVRQPQFVGESARFYSTFHTPQGAAYTDRVD
jgi:hypothetical protein